MLLHCLVVLYLFNAPLIGSLEIAIQNKRLGTSPGTFKEPLDIVMF